MNCSVLKEDLETLRCDRCEKPLIWSEDEECYISDCCDIGYYAYPQYKVYSMSLSGN